MSETSPQTMNGSSSSFDDLIRQGLPIIVILESLVDCQELIDVATQLPKPNYIYLSNFHLQALPDPAECVNINLRYPESLHDWLDHLEEVKGIETAVYIIHNLFGFGINGLKEILSRTQSCSSQCMLTARRDQIDQYVKLLTRGCIVWDPSTGNVNKVQTSNLLMLE
jgi:hypothetical protein